MKSHIKIPAPFRDLNQVLNPIERRRNGFERWLIQNCLTLEATQDYIFGLIRGREAKFVGRPGGTESVGLEHFLKTRLLARKLNFTRRYPRFFRRYALPYSGLRFRQESDADLFCYRYLVAALDSDLLAFGHFASGSMGLAGARLSSGLPFTWVRHLEPWWALHKGLVPWTEGLRGLRVLVVHPFKRTIESQFERIRKVSGVRDLLPEFDLQVVRPPTTTVQGEGDWFEEFAELSERVSAVTFDVAIVGAGSYGLPLCREIAREGRKALHLGGSTQLLFGIRGRRWASSAMLRGRTDLNWVNPLDEDLFPGVVSIEGGSYH